MIVAHYPSKNSFEDMCRWLQGSSTSGSTNYISYEPTGDSKILPKRIPFHHNKKDNILCIYMFNLLPSVGL